MKDRLQKAWGILPRLAVAGLFVFAAGPKIYAPEAFIVGVGNYRMLPPLGAYITGVYLPWLELVVALALVGPRRFRDGAWLLAGALCALFAVAQSSAWLRGLDIACGCFGDTDKIGIKSVALRLGLFGFVIWSWRCDHGARNRQVPVGATQTL
jgi:hypothetical protein